MELPYKRKRRRPQRRCMYVVKEDMQRLHVTKEEASDRLRWRQMIPCGNP